VLKQTEKISPEQFKLYLIIAGSIGGFFIFFMNSPGKNPFLNLGLGIWDTYGMASGLLGDLLSYVRLFALGISSAVLGNVFNQLAFSLSPDIIVVRQLVILLILLFGHGLNFFMSALGSFVHPLRLTFVEFYKNAGFSGGGKKYDPFRRALNIE
jgi:V/A-type H+-transporting ATPase subunit I